MTIHFVIRLSARAVNRLGAGERGRVAADLRAGLVLVDVEWSRDTATYEEPRR